MYPVLLDLGPLKLYSYGLMMAVAFLVGIYWATFRAKRYGVSSDFISNISIVWVISGIVGGRVAYLLIEESVADIFSLKFFEVWKGGMVFYGGFLAAAIATKWYSKRHEVSTLTLGVIASPTVALAHVFGRLGCLLAGCCYGKQCLYSWAITFRNPQGLAPLNIPLHPTQLYEAGGNLLIVVILVMYQKYQRFRGQILALYLMLYAVLRAVVEIFRGDEARGFIDFFGIYPNEWLSTSTVISLGLFVLGAAIWTKSKDYPFDFVTTARSLPSAKKA